MIEAFLHHLLTQKRVAHNTYISYKTDLCQFENFLMEEKISLSCARREHIAKFLAALAQKNVSVRSRSRKLSCLKAFYNWLYKVHDWTDITLDVPFPKLEHRLPNVLTENHIQALFEAMAKDETLLGKRNQLIFYLMYATGLRVSELTCLHVSHIDFESHLLRVQGKGGKERIVPLPEAVVILLRNYLDHVWPHLCTEVKTQHDILFPVMYNKRVKPMSRQVCWLILKQLCKEIGFSTDISPHYLRHSLATHLLEHGMDLKSLQLLLGHERISTVEIYTHVEKKRLRKLYNQKHPRA